jgi:hypothetical protein
VRKVGVGRAMTQLPLRGRMSGSVGVSPSFDGWFVGDQSVHRVLIGCCC